MQKIIIVDVFGFFFRSFYALPRLNFNGFPTGLLTGFIRLVDKLYNTQDGKIVFCADSKGDSFRKELYPDYKANRKPPPQELLMQLPIALEWLRTMGFELLELSGFEADDIIASLAHTAKNQNMQVEIITHDKDLYQLIEDGKIHILDEARTTLVDSQKCFEKFGVYPQNFVDYQAIVGDSSDNIPGAKRIGKVGAPKLINEFKTIENLYENIEKVSNPRTKELLLQSKDNVFLSKKLAQLKTDIDLHEQLGKNLELIKTPTNPTDKILDELQKYKINLTKKQKKPMYVAKKTYKLITDPKELLDLCKKIVHGSIVSFDTETNSLDTKHANIVGFSFCTKDGAYYVPIGHKSLLPITQIPKQTAKEAIQIIFSHKVVAHNAKFDKVVLRTNFDLDVTFYRDTMIMAWLADPSSKVSLSHLAKKHLNKEMIEFSQVVNKNETFASVDPQIACDYAAEDADITYELYGLFSKNMEPSMLAILDETEMPFVDTLIDFEKYGFCIDRDFLKKYNEKISHKIDELSAQIYALANTHFNINSPSQLSAILFDNLKLPKGKKIKTGYSTNEQTLQGLLGTHEIIAKIIAYREHFKLRSTYCTPILERTKEQKRLRTSLLQTGTSTGRLSSQNPNLQNIPVKSDLGREFRRAFVCEDGFTFASFDYSQIELRLLAHFSNDPTMIEAFKNDRDIHYETAKKLFSTQDAKQMRPLAKSINFGLIYGMGSSKLAQEVGIERKQAKQYIEEYFANFPTVKDFLNSQKELAKQRGFSQTLLGRKRLFDFENTKSPMLISAYEREAVNTIFQGSASDLIKLCMNKIYKRFEFSKDIHPILQIHDELIYEIRLEKMHEYTQIIKEIMEQIFTLKIPLKVGLSIGKTWSELK